MLGVFGHSDLVLQPPRVSLLLWQPPTSLPTNFLQWRWENSSVVHFIPSKSTDTGGAAMQLQHSYVQVLYTQQIIFTSIFPLYQQRFVLPPAWLLIEATKRRAGLWPSIRGPVLL